MSRRVSVRKSISKLFSRSDSNLGGSDGAEKVDNKCLGGEKAKKKRRKRNKKRGGPAAQRCLNWSHSEQDEEDDKSTQDSYMKTSLSTNESLDTLESEDVSSWSPVPKSEKRYFSLSESDLRSRVGGLGAFGSDGGDSLLGPFSTLPGKATTKRGKESEARAEQRDYPHSWAAREEGSESGDGRQCQKRVWDTDILSESYPESSQCDNIPDSPHQTSSAVISATEHNLPGWAEEVLSTCLAKVNTSPLPTEDPSHPATSPIASQSEGGSCELPQVPGRQPQGKRAKTKYNILITLTKAEEYWKGEGNAGGLVPSQTGVPERAESHEVPMAQTHLQEEGEPVGSVPIGRTEECQRNVLEPPLGRFSHHYISPGYEKRAENSKHPGGHITTSPVPSLGEPVFSRFLQRPPNIQTESRTSLNPASFPLQKAGGLESSQENTRKVGVVNSGTMNISSQIGAEGATLLSTHISSQIAASPDSSHITNSTVQQQSHGGFSDIKNGISESPNSSLQLSIADSGHTVSQISNPGERSVANGSDGSLSGNPTQSSSTEDISSHSTMNSPLQGGRIANDSMQQPGKLSQLGGGDVSQNVDSSGSIQLINTLHGQNPDQNGLAFENRHASTTEESVSAKVKLDQIPGSQLVGTPLQNPENGSILNAPKYSLDPFKADTTKQPASNSETAPVQNPTEGPKGPQAGSSVTTNAESQEQTFRNTPEKTGQEGSGEPQPSGSLILQKDLSIPDSSIQSQRENCPTNVLDDPDGLLEIDGFVDAIRNLESPMLLSRNKSVRSQKPHSFSSPFCTLPPIEEDQTTHKNPLPLLSSTETSQQPSGTLSLSERPLPSLPSQLVSPAPRVDFSNTPRREILTPLEMMKMQLEDKPRITVQRASAESSIVFQSSFQGKLDFNTNSTNKDSESRWSRLNNSLLYSNYKKPSESFSTKSLDRNLKSTPASPVSPSTTSPNLMYRGLSLEDAVITMKATDLRPTTTFLAGMFEGDSMDGRRPSLHSSISDRLMTGSNLSDSGRKFRRISLPSNLEQCTIANEKPRKITAFPDALKCTPKDQGKINPRPSKIIIYDKSNFAGFQREISCDVSDCSSWPFPAVISVRVIRGCWVAFEKPDYKGKKFIFGEEDVELVDPWSEEVKEEAEDPNSEPPPSKPIVIGSLRRAVRDYSIPQISLFPDANGEGKKLTFHGESEDARIFGFPPRVISIIVNSGLWLVYSEPFFEGQQCILEVGGYRTLEEWGAEKAQVGSLMPIQMGAPRVEKPYEPKVSIFEKPYFTGRSREVYNDSPDFLSRYPNNGAALANAGSIKVLGGIWVGYSKEGFRGHQYLLEEGEFLDWRSWGGFDEDLKSMRLIRADFSNPAIVLNETTDQEEKDPLVIVDSVPDLELVDVRDIIQSINVLSGVWVVYEGVNYSGSQYIVEKGSYRNPQDWGAQNCKISSLHPILLVEPIGQQLKMKIKVYSEFEFSGPCLTLEDKKMGIPRDFKMQSCRVLSGSWALYEGQDYDGRVFVVGEGEYPDLQSMGCRMTTHIRSIKTVPHVFSEPSLTLYSLENLEGKEIELDSEMKNLLADGYNNLVLSLRVHGGVWVIYEHSNFRGRQVLLEPIEILNWPKYSSFSRIGSLSPVTQKAAFFQIKNKHTQDLLSVTVCQEDVKSGRVIIAPENKELEQLWFYEKGMLKPKFSPDMSLQTIGQMTDAGSKVVLWSEKRMPKHCWTFELSGTIRSLLYKGFVLDIKGGKSYDRDSAMICKCDEEKPEQQWEIQML